MSNIVGAGQAVPAQREREVPKELEDLDRLVSGIRSSLDALVARLDPVCVIGAQPPDAPKSAIGATAPLAVKIAMVNAELREIRGIIESTTAGLEI